MKSPKIAVLGSHDYLTKSISKSCASNYDFLTISRPTSQLSGGFLAAIVHHDPPTYNGIQHLREIKTHYPDLSIIILSVNPTPHDIIEAFRYGASDFLFLPLQPIKLQNCLLRLQPGTNSSRFISWWKKFISLFSPKRIRKQNKMLPPPPQQIVDIGDSDHSSDTNISLKPDLKIQFIGSFKPMIYNRDFPRFPGKKVKTLLAYLLFCHPKPVHREILIDKFWQDSTTESARNCLNVTLYAIRKVIEEVAPGENVICFKDESYFINPDFIVERDIDLIEKHWKQGRSIEQTQGIDAALKTYYQAFEFLQGDFLEDLPYEEWTEREREKYKEIWLVILDRLSAHFLNNQKHDICLNLCKQMLLKDPCLEEVHRRLMTCYNELGKRDKAIRQYQKCQKILKKELDIEPCTSTKKLFSDISAF